eukprot:2937544-Amphidinium_carterae.1
MDDACITWQPAPRTITTIRTLTHAVALSECFCCLGKGSAGSHKVRCLVMSCVYVTEQPEKWPLTSKRNKHLNPSSPCGLSETS